MNNDLVGRYFMEHLEIKSAELWLFKPDPFKLYTYEFWSYKGQGRIGNTFKQTGRISKY